MKEIYDQIIELVRNNVSTSNDSHVKFSDINYRPYDFNKENFHEIKSSKSDNKIVFIDGGSAEILKSSNFSLNLIRIYYTIYRKNKRIESKKHDFYSFISTKNIYNELFYGVEFIGMNEDIFPNKKDLLLNSFDETIKNGVSRANISNVSNVVRRFSELKIAINIINDLNENDIIVLDGSLQCTFTNERKYFEELYKKGLSKNIMICGISKTTTLMTDIGNSITSALNKFNVDGKWLYHPVVDIKSNNHQAEMSFVKLHAESKYIFRFEIYNEQQKNIKDVLDLIAMNCKDSVFIGYPYGLIEADRQARISNQEKDLLITLFSVKLSKDWKKIKESLSATDAHEILDKIG